MSSLARRALAQPYQGHNFYRRWYGVNASSEDSCPFSPGGLHAAGARSPVEGSKRRYGVNAAPQETCPFSAGGSPVAGVSSPVEVGEGVLETDIKPFEAIPGPKALPGGLGTLYKYLPYIGEYCFSELHHTGRRKYEQFGPIVRENICGDVNLLLLFDPKDIEQMYLSDGRYPMRRSHLAISKYRLDRPHMYSSAGLFPTNGEKWWELRSGSQKVMNKPQIIRSNLPELNEVSKDLIHYIASNSSSNTVDIDEFLKPLQKGFLESIVLQTLNTRLGCFGSASPHYKGTKKDVEELITAAVTTDSTILTTDNGLQLWKFFDTPLYKKLCWGQDTIYKTALALVEHRETELSSTLEKENGKSMLDALLLDSGLDKKSIVTVVCDSLMASVSTGSFTAGYILYHLATNPEKQNILAQEVHSLMESNGEVTSSFLNSAKYLRAVVKESSRLNPISIGVGRIAQKDIVIGGYRIPKDTVLITQNQVLCRLPENFPNPDSFIPERWLSRGSISPHLVLPFGHGPRACIGRRVAEQSIYTLVAHLIHNFKIEWRGTELDCKSILINEPNQPLRFRFTPRTL